MSFDLRSLNETIAEHGPVIRVVVAKVEGSAPREVGASMLIWSEGQSGTIGGGALEWQACKDARANFTDKPRLVTIPLGPDLGQCCGGAVTLVAEYFDLQQVNALDPHQILRRVDGASPIPFSLQKSIADMRNAQVEPTLHLSRGWLFESVKHPTRNLWIFGAGHVGRALVSVLSPIADLEIMWVDSELARYPIQIPSNVTVLPAKNPADAVELAPNHAEHLVLTYSHVFDLEICHRILRHGFQSCGLIGSKTKWARFRKKLGQLGHTEAQIQRIFCPIGQPELGKQPQAIAVGVAAGLLSAPGRQHSVRDLVG